MNIAGIPITNIADVQHKPCAWLTGTTSVVKMGDGTYLVPEDFDENKVYFVLDMATLPKPELGPIRLDFIEDPVNMTSIRIEAHMAMRLWKRH